MAIKGTEFGPFASAARELAGYGLAVIPCGRDHGKRPSVNWPKRRPHPDGPAIKAWTVKFSGANIGIITGLSDVTIVDIDDPELVAAMLERFGDTPLQTQTPSGGRHLWYRSAGEKCANLRSHGLAVDIKAKGGFVVVPPSIRPSGPHAGKRYEFVVGDWSKLRDIPRLLPGALPSTVRSNVQSPAPSDKGPEIVPLSCASTGARNDTLLRRLKDEFGLSCQTFDELVQAAKGINATFNPPMGDQEVAEVAGRIWNWKAEGRLLVKGQQGTFVRREDLDRYHGDANAFMLDMALRLQHGPQANGICVSDKSMAASGFIEGWSRHRYQSARNGMLEAGTLILGHKGGSGAGDAATYNLTKGHDFQTLLKGYENQPEYNLPPSPLAPPSPPPCPDRAVEQSGESPSVQRDEQTSQQANPRRRRKPRDCQPERDPNTIDWVEAWETERGAAPAPSDILVGELVFHLAKSEKGEQARIAHQLGVKSCTLSNFKRGAEKLSPTRAALLRQYLQEKSA